MKDYIKSELKHIPVTIILIVLFYGIKVIADSYALTSTEISFDNSGTNITATNMQNAINETFLHATDYNEIKTTIGNSTLTTTNQTLTGAVDEINGRFTNGVLSVTNGGTGANTAANARTNLGLGNAATQTVANNLTTASSTSGYVLDARQGKILSDKVNKIQFSGSSAIIEFGADESSSWFVFKNSSGTALWRVYFDSSTGLYFQKWNGSSWTGYKHWS